MIAATLAPKLKPSEQLVIHFMKLILTALIIVT
jgi:hypothetical protein